MNRENVFRGKRLDNYEWVEGYYVKCRKHYYILPIYDECGFDERWLDWTEVDPNTVGQHCDDISRYEGDICEYKDGQHEHIGILTFGRYATTDRHIGWNIKWIQAEDRWLRQDVLFWNEEQEIKWIGNIHDNPELLGGRE